MPHSPLVPALFLLLLLPGCTQAQEDAPPVSSAETLIQKLKPLTANLPEPLKTGILSSPREFLEDLSTLEGDEELLVLVDKNHSLTEKDVPPDLVDLKSVPGLVLSRQDLSLRRIILPGILALVEGARKAGHTLVWSSSYRSYTYQKQVFTRYAARDGEEKANTYSARPGQSQHQLGTAADFGDITLAFGRTPEGRWLRSHAGDFGWSLSFPEGLSELTGYQYEPWHFRYIGIPACRVQKKWFGDVQHHLLTFWHYHGRQALDLRLEL